MNRLTTPHFIFTLPFDTSRIKCLRVYFQQSGEIVLEKKTEHCEMDGSDIKLRLTQEETAQFDCKRYARIQLHILTVDDEAIVSDVHSVDVGECLGSEVIA